MAFKIFTRRDDDCGVFVAYVPSLAIYTQAITEEDLIRAAKSAICIFISLCHQRGTMIHVTKPKVDRRWIADWAERFIEVPLILTPSLN